MFGILDIGLPQENKNAFIDKHIEVARSLSRDKLAARQHLAVAKKADELAETMERLRMETC